MKTKKLLMVLAVIGLVLAVSGTTKAVELPEGPIIWKAFNYDEATSYAYQDALIASVANPATDLDNRFYFRDAGAGAYTETFGHITYSAANPNHFLFSGNANPLDDLVITGAANAVGAEDSWGLFELTHLFPGQVIPDGFNPVTGQDAITQAGSSVWEFGDNGEYLNGIFYGLDDQVVYMRDFVPDPLPANPLSGDTYNVTIWSDGLEAKLWVKDSTLDPESGGTATGPSMRSGVDAFPGWTGTPGNEWLILESDYSRFTGSFDSFDLPTGDTEVFLNVTGGNAVSDPDMFLDFWTDPYTLPDAEGPTFPYDILQSWKIGQPFKVSANGWVGSEDTAKGYVGSQDLLECRVTGGGVDEYTGLWDGTMAKAQDEEDDGTNQYTFGGQAGAPTGCQPQPWGNWTHHQKKGPAGSFTFHAGTASAPPGTEIDWIACADEGWCVQARPAPAKQINFAGVGTFKNIRKSPLATGPDKVVPGETFHWFEVHIEDLGEPGKAGKVDPPAPQCPPEGSEGTLADCECPDYYRITIYKAFDPAGAPDQANVIYEVFGYIKGGNLQIHPALPCK